MCTDVTHKDFITVHHELTHIQYFLNYRNNPKIFRDGANPGMLQYQKKKLLIFFIVCLLTAEKWVNDRNNVVIITFLFLRKYVACVSENVH